uniref:Uncharacterized protein n=1 Tax=Aplanochytrium stocchinoi TaxID=215587 RepID=A0A7S3LJ18_9STRA|mmetsp:Transcript_2113/g.2705  ORF Transcript_2113/g.2705 Transcript_2113/m.2705 type:complete len:104 (-) Transcript_2113:249-560(-)
MTIVVFVISFGYMRKSIQLRLVLPDLKANFCIDFFTTKPVVMEENYLADHRFLSENEYRLRSKAATAQHMSDLVRSRDFQKWAIQNAHRITVSSYSECVKPKN